MALFDSVISIGTSLRKNMESPVTSLLSKSRLIMKYKQTEAIKDSSKILLFGPDACHVNSPHASSEIVVPDKRIFCSFEENTVPFSYKVRERPFMATAKSCFSSSLFHTKSLFLLNEFAILFIMLLYKDCRPQLIILFSMGILNVHRQLSFQVTFLYVFFEGKSIFCSILKLIAFNKFHELTFRERTRIGSSSIECNLDLEYIIFICKKMRQTICDNKPYLYHNVQMKKSSNTVLIKWKDVTKLKVSLLRKLTKISCLPWFKSHALEIFDTQGNNLVQSKSLSEFRKADKKPDSYNEYGSDGDSVLSRLRYLFQVSEQVLTWRFEYIVPIYYVMKQPNPFFESTLFRLSTYSKWPPKAPQIFSSYLVDAGFYFDQNSEEILCFSCGLCINVSELEYHSSRCSVLQMHLQYSEKCEYALNKMREISGSDTIDGRQPAVQRDELECSNVELARSNGHSQLNSFVPVVPEKEEYSSMAQVASTTEKDFSYSSMQFAQPTSEEDAVPLCVSSSHQEVVLPSIHLMQKDLSYGKKSLQQNGEVSAAGMPRVYNYDLKHPEYKETEKRMKSFRTPNTPHILIMKMYDVVVAGFFFTGESDIVRCFCCDMGLAEWMEEDIPWEEHAKHSPRCPYLIEEMGEEFIGRVQAQWSRIYSPKHPAYTEYNLRLESFRTFPAHVTQSRDEIAAAGFFYTGELDIVRCHYCDGGLRDWEPGDEPWQEHAKWFPFCKYLLKVKGRDYVENAVSSNIEEQASEEVVHNGNQFSEPQDLPQGRPISQSTTNDLDPEVKSVLLSLGYNLTTINRAVTEFRQQRGNRPYNADEIMNIILDMGEREANSTPTFGGTATQNHVARSSQSNYLQELTAGEGENNVQELLSPEEIRNQIMCVKCKVNERRILFTPCGHRLLCEKCCSSGISKCLSCGKKIKHKLKTYLS